MKIVQVGSLPTKVPPKHTDVFIREILGPGSGYRKLAVAHAVMLAHGGAEMHAHAESDHVFYVLSGELQVDNGKETAVLTAGESLIIPAGEPHQVTGTGRTDCQYLNIMCPPPSAAVK